MRFTFSLTLAVSASEVLAATFVVSTAADNGNNAAPTPNSLRAAIVQANNAAGPSQIDFALPSCPTTFTFSGNTALPDITKDVTIDGYSQTGAVQNTLHGAFNANLCVALNGKGSIADGLHTSGNGRLSVSGLILYGFTDAAVRLDAGTGNVVSGNQIGGLPQNNEGVHISGTSVASTVGSVSGLSVPGAANLIIGSTGAAISIDGSAGGNMAGGNVIGGNLIGADGSSAIGNYAGVYIYQSPNNDVVSNVIANNGNGGVTISGASAVRNVLQDNFIGETYNGPHAPNGNSTQAGVLINFGAADNIIGAEPGSTTHGNTIYALGSAIWVSASGGAANSILANQEMFSGSGLPVDLDAPGPTANGSFGSGPNNLQHYPEVLAAYRTSTGEWIEGTLDADVTTTYRLDFYWGPCCSGTRGNATYFTGGVANVTTAASGQVHFWARLPANSYPSDGAIMATATDPAGDTSESGTYAQEIIGDMIFRDDFEVH